jgi:hypothetical protein
MGPGIFAPFGVLLGVLIILFVGSALLRAAVAMANRVIGPIVPKNTTIGWDWDADDEEEEEELHEASRLAMPEPGISQGMLIVFLALVVNLAVSLFLAAVLDTRRPFDWADDPGLHLFATAVGFVAMLGLLAGMLPTRAGRAALATLFFHLILIVLLVMIYGLARIAFAR